MTNTYLTTTLVNENGELVTEMFPGTVEEMAIPGVGEGGLLEYGILSVKAAIKKEDDDDDEDEVEEGGDDDDEKDDWEATEEEDEWDPDFDEFDIPKSTKKGKAGKGDEEDDIKFDEDLNEFDDLFGDGGDDFDEEDDF